MAHHLDKGLRGEGRAGMPHLPGSLLTALPRPRRGRALDHGHRQAPGEARPAWWGGQDSNSSTASQAWPSPLCTPSLHFPHRDPIFSFCFTGEGNPGSERLGHLPKVTQLSQASLPPGPLHQLSPCRRTLPSVLDGTHAAHPSSPGPTVPSPEAPSLTTCCNTAPEPLWSHPCSEPASPPELLVHSQTNFFQNADPERAGAESVLFTGQGRAWSAGRGSAGRQRHEGMHV